MQEEGWSWPARTCRKRGGAAFQGYAGSEVELACRKRGGAGQTAGLQGHAGRGGGALQGLPCRKRGGAGSDMISTNLAPINDSD